MKPEITVIQPSRGRPHEPARVYQTLKAQADAPFEYLLAVDNEDPSLEQYRKAFAPHESEWVRLLAQDSHTAVEAINMAASQSTGDILLVMSDDFELAPHWDSIIHKATRGKSRWLLKTNDGLQNWIATLPIMDRALYQKLGYVYHPAYRHMYADTHLSSICDLMGATIYRLDILFPHRHYSTGAREMDGVNERANASYEAGEATLLKHHRDNYGLSPEEIIGSIKGKNQLSWLKSKLAL